ncbi:hypothetical protein F9B85_01095 [Heliorestis acidaminivorans]|uniref:DUF541 domain-containing protein n=1 Tax=Heliorestis acidaminivorans TaxID=553427 RepID=A0A6I0F3J7_9FIRM|nr:hypothetical protein [Heliorestis acidaminivorans]KAB2954320.1 hypothetical protein F9B85_01095 [Heliorestis acidaminivorans]
MLTSRANKVVAVFLGFIIFTAFYLSSQHDPSPNTADSASAVEEEKVLLTVTGRSTWQGEYETTNLDALIAEARIEAEEIARQMNHKVGEALSIEIVKKEEEQTEHSTVQSLQAIVLFRLEP